MLERIAPDKRFKDIKKREGIEVGRWWTKSPKFSKNPSSQIILMGFDNDFSRFKMFFAENTWNLFAKNDAENGKMSKKALKLICEDGFLLQYLCVWHDIFKFCYLIHWN